MTLTTSQLLTLCRRIHAKREAARLAGLPVGGSYRRRLRRLHGRVCRAL